MNFSGFETVLRLCGLCGVELADDDAACCDCDDDADTAADSPYSTEYEARSPIVRITDRFGGVTQGAVGGITARVVERAGEALVPWLRYQVERVDEGKAPLIHEPEPWHCVVYPAWRPGHVGPGVAVDLRDALIEEVAPARALQEASGS